MNLKFIQQNLFIATIVGSLSFFVIYLYIKISKILQRIRSNCFLEKMAYFSLKCFEPKIGRYIIIGLNVVLLILGIIHFGYVGLMGNFISLYKDFGKEFYDKIAPSFNSIMAFYAITAIIQIIVSVFMILLALQVLGKDKQFLWVRIVIAFLMIQFGFNFYVAVYSSMAVTMWNSFFKDTLQQAYSWIEDLNPDSGLPEITIQTFKNLINFMRFCYVEAILTWVIAVPSIIITLFSLADQLITEENVYKFVLTNENSRQTAKIQPNNDQITLDKIKRPN